MSALELEEVPIPKQVNSDLFEAFKHTLEALFKEHKPVRVYANISLDSPAVREKSLAYLADVGKQNARLAAYWACDTGVPNDKILAAYILLFT